MKGKLSNNSVTFFVNSPGFNLSHKARYDFLQFVKFPENFLPVLI